MIGKGGGIGSDTGGKDGWKSRLDLGRRGKSPHECKASRQARLGLLPLLPLLTMLASGAP